VQVGKTSRLSFGSRIERKDLMGAIAPGNDHAGFSLKSFVYGKTPAKAVELKISTEADFKLGEFA